MCGAAIFMFADLTCLPPCPPPPDVRATLPQGVDVLAFQCRNPIHRAHYELFIRALDAPNVSKDAVCLVHPTCGPTQVRARCGVGQARWAGSGAAAITMPAGVC